MKESESSPLIPTAFAKRLKFYVTSPQPCPYLPDKSERKVFASLTTDGAVPLNDSLTRSGFRRSQTIAYRPACAGCNACKSVRIVVDDFEWKRRWRKIEKRNQDLQRTPQRAAASREQFRLLKRYLDSRHSDGGMNEMELRDYVNMVDASPVRTVVFEYRGEPEPDYPDGPLIAAALTDILRDGLSMVYSFYRPEEDRRSLGVHMILSHIRLAQELHLPYVYLGYWVKNSPKMGYKTDFGPLEMFDGENWRRMTEQDYI
ncbi:MAG: arginyltransferase [Hirschia sp.]|nr:arginyltransferase [Hirschia sp.]MBF17114.1 arginyltransferase [Hirschia sp.]|tara:strand:- start:64 stop:840 length:777 start_codon:yes stop_codon:yes gene_type:complete